MEIAFRLIFFVAHAIYSWKEERKVRLSYYGDHNFRRCDRDFKRRYRWLNPYRISKKFLSSKGERDIHTYGETPLTSLERIGRKLALKEGDLFLDLGCGRGRGVFFIHHLFGCRAVGVDWVPMFIEIAKTILCPVDFLCCGMECAPIREASAIYIAWTCMEERMGIEEALREAKPGTRVATVSYPISSKDFIRTGSLFISFPWGEGEVFFHERKNES